MNSKGRECASWYGIADRAKAIWRAKVAQEDSKLEEAAMKITMVLST